MIQLRPIPRPAELTDELVAQLTAEFLADPTKRVWDKSFIVKALRMMSYDKCCYCECRINEESKYMEVEHYHAKSLYPNLVVDWNNLLPGCKRCNGEKSNHDVVAEPIIHPVLHNPKEHLRLEKYRFYPKTDLGRKTIETLYLNDREKLQDKRYQVGSKITEYLDELEADFREFGTAISPQKIKRLSRKLRGIMQQGQPGQEYSATVATEILREDSYHFAKAELIKLSLWDADFQHLEEELTKIAF